MAIYEAWQGSLGGDLSDEDYAAIYALDGAIEIDNEPIQLNVPVEALGNQAVTAIGWDERLAGMQAPFHKPGQVVDVDGGRHSDIQNSLWAIDGTILDQQ